MSRTCCIPGWQASPSFLAILLAVIALAGCDADDGGSRVKAPFGPVAPTTAFSFDSRLTNGSLGPVTIQGEGSTVEVGGRDFNAWRVDYGAPGNDNRLAVWATPKNPTTWVVGGFEKAGSMTVTADSPVTLNLDPPVGEPQTLTASGTTMTPSDPAPRTATGTLIYTLEAENVTIDSRFGVVTGTRVFSGEGVVDGDGVFEVFRGVPVKGKIWYHPELGVVRAELPDWAAGMDLLEVRDYGDENANPALIQQVGLVSTGSPTWSLSTDERRGVFDADKMTHAKMLLELRWADDDMARTVQEPAVEVEFGTIWGTFPYQMVSSPVSFFHPEENGEGYTYWYAFVDQAAKNEPGPNGILYQITVGFPDYMTHPVRATGRILYHWIAP